MGNKHSGNHTARGTTGNKGGTGRPPKQPEKRLTKTVRISQDLFDRINEAAVDACYDDWRAYLDNLVPGDE